MEHSTRKLTAERLVSRRLEGSHARGRNRASLYQVALGSAKESKACLDVAIALGYVQSIDGEILAGLSSICAVLYRLVT